MAGSSAGTLHTAVTAEIDDGLPLAADAEASLVAQRAACPATLSHVPEPYTVATSRRKFIQGAAQTGIAAATLTAFPPSIRKALAIPAFHETGTIRDVKHVVILMQENRAFDHYFGTLKGIRGFGDRFTVPQPGGRSVWEQLDRNGNPVLPCHLDATQGNAQRVSGTPHRVLPMPGSPATHTSARCRPQAWLQARCSRATALPRPMNDGASLWLVNTSVAGAGGERFAAVVAEMKR